ncbi:hypothetical protein KFK09_017621 [Dendrobium nobile]|uniref:Uncharacterized protein n=1 Tax=Dendrobium nobile TaxID=94219 RepID=A0A8T3B7U1_DENNO|nr:hypothetical protein KFK09_017621 [Dendrobium nobile]
MLFSYITHALFHRKKTLLLYMAGHSMLWMDDDPLFSSYQISDNHLGSGDETLRFWNVFPAPKYQVGDVMHQMKFFCCDIVYRGSTENWIGATFFFFHDKDDKVSENKLDHPIYKGYTAVLDSKFSDETLESFAS